MSAKEILKQLTLKEKISLCIGDSLWRTTPIERLNIPPILMIDGPHGPNKYEINDDEKYEFTSSIQSISFPSACCTCCSFDRNVMYQMGSAIGDEMVKDGISILLGPGVNIKRSPLCGRNFEYFSEDPILATIIAGSLIKGIQSRGVGACIKHFAANNQETRRFFVSANIDERTFHEIYLSAFEGAIRDARPWVIMSSYNLINGIQSSVNKELLTKILREDWKWNLGPDSEFTSFSGGMVISDWFGTYDRIEGFKAGLDLSMPSEPIIDQMVEEVKKGNLDVELVDTAAAHVLNVVLKASEIINKSKTDQSIQFGVGMDKIEGFRDLHHEISREIAENCIVLLKNDDNILPLPLVSKSEKINILFVGKFAKNPHFQGLGSAHVEQYKVENCYDCSIELINKYKESENSNKNSNENNNQNSNNNSNENNNQNSNNNSNENSNQNNENENSNNNSNENENSGKVEHKSGAMGNNTNDNSKADTKSDAMSDEFGVSILYVEGFDTANGKTTEEMKEQTIEASTQADIVVIFAGTPDSQENENKDLTEIKLPPDEDDLIDEIVKVNKNVVVVLQNGAPLEMPWADKVKGILETYFCGEAGGKATANILFGLVNPSGHLGETFPIKISDNPSFYNFPGHGDSVEYSEGIFVGYRYYDTYNVNVLFPFGYGLSYTTFKYSNIRLPEKKKMAQIPGGFDFLDNDPNIFVLVDVQNTGKVAGKTVAQLYVSDQTGVIMRPMKELKDFQKVLLQPGELKTLKFHLNRRCFSFWNTEIHDWYVPSGNFVIVIGQSSRDYESLLLNISIKSTSKE